MTNSYQAPTLTREGTLAELTAGSDKSTTADGGIVHITPVTTLLKTTSHV